MYRYSRPGSNTADLRTDKNAAVSGKCDMGGGDGGRGAGGGGRCWKDVVLPVQNGDQFQRRVQNNKIKTKLFH